MGEAPSVTYTMQSSDSSNGRKHDPIEALPEYLGTVLSDDVHDSDELVRRIAMAKADFLALSCIWRRSSLTWSRKLVVFSALVESRLLYGIRIL